MFQENQKACIVEGKLLTESLWLINVEKRRKLPVLKSLMNCLERSDHEYASLQKFTGAQRQLIDHGPTVRKSNLHTTESIHQRPNPLCIHNPGTVHPPWTFGCDVKN